MKIPLAAIHRLSLYYRTLLGVRDDDFISSDEIAKRTGFTAAQVRKDLAYFGQFGIPSKGYRIDELKRTISKILGTDKAWDVALIGVGNLGMALLAYKGFEPQGFKIKCAFDNDLRKIGRALEGVVIQDISELKPTLKKEKIRIAIVTVRSDSAQEVVDMLVKAGVTAILNFAPIRPRVPKDVDVLNIDLAIELERLAYFLTRSEKRR